MQDEVKNDAGELIRFRTRKLNITVARHQYSGAGGEPRWTLPFYFSKMVNGELVRFPLPAEPRDAERVANQIAAFLELPTHTLADARRMFNPRALARGSAFSTIGELFEFHTEHFNVLELRGRTGPGYQGSLLYIVRAVSAWRHHREIESWNGIHGKRMAELLAPWLEKPINIVTAKMAMDFQRLMVPGDIEDEEEEITAKISCDSFLRGAKAMFSKEAMKLYAASDTLTIPDMTDFLAVSLFNARKYFELPATSVIKAVFRDAPALKRHDLNAYRAFLLCAQVGLRKTEAANLKMEWLNDDEAPTVHIHEDGAFRPKHGHGRRVIIPPWVRDEMEDLQSASPYFLDGRDSERTDAVFDRLNAWLRDRGITATKPTHELRKLWFSQKVKLEGLTAAAQQGGHRDPKVTTSFYADNQLPAGVIPFWQQPTVDALASMGERTA